MKTTFLLPMILALPTFATADSTLIDTSLLPTRTVHDVATMTPLALTAQGAPALMILDLEDVDEVPPHAASSGLRLLTVLSGELSWGDGTVADPSAERVFGPGSLLTISAGDPHWLAARQGPVRLQVVLLDDEMPVPGVQEQMQ